MNSMYEFINEFRQVVGDDVVPAALQVHHIALRATLVYLFGVALVRIGKSRLIGRSSPVDVLVGIMLGALLGGVIIGKGSLINGMVGAVVLVGLHWLCTAIACRSHAFGNLFKGRAKVLYANGEMNEPSMRSSHLSVHDLMEALRFQANVESLSEVKMAYKERNGEISIVRKSSAGSGDQ